MYRTFNENPVFTTFTFHACVIYDLTLFWLLLYFSAEEDMSDIVSRVETEAVKDLKNQIAQDQIKIKSKLNFFLP